MRLFFLLALLLPMVAHSELVPEPGLVDSRVRTIDYDAAQVVKIETYYGVSTHVRFAESELIEDIALGDAEAWQVIPRTSHFFLKPKALNADTNATVVTNKRVYHFMLLVRGNQADEVKAWRNPALIYSLSFRYPQEEEASRLEALRVSDLKTRLDEALSGVNTKSGGFRNADYWVAGALDASPEEAYDDGLFTYLTFASNMDMPAVYVEDEKGRESLVNSHVEGNVIVVHRVGRKVILRMGEKVICVVNRSFDPKTPREDESRTSVPAVQRRLKEKR